MQTFKLDTVISYRTNKEGVVAFGVIDGIFTTKMGESYHLADTGMEDSISPDDIVQAYRPVGKIKRARRNATPRKIAKDGQTKAVAKLNAKTREEQNAQVKTKGKKKAKVEF